MSELIEHQKIGAIVENINQAKADIAEGFRMLKAGKDRIKAALGGSHYYHHFIRDRLSDYEIEGGEAAEESLKIINRNAWRYLLDQTGMKQLMTPNRRKEIEAQIESNELPELTVDNALGTMCGLASRVDELLAESMRYVFNWLRPWNSKLKTNDHWKIGPRVIVHYGCQRSWSDSGFQLNYRRDAEFRALGNVFSLLDGNGIEQYPKDLFTRFNEAMKTKDRGDKFTDQYFEFKCYRNGNVHIKFMRLDLVAKLNKVASGNELPGI